MADDIDKAQQYNELFLNVAIHNHQIKQKQNVAPKSTGYCLNCGDSTSKKRWCDADCRDDWQKRQGK